jgi:hypothetical protein
VVILAASVGQACTGYRYIQFLVPLGLIWALQTLVAGARERLPGIDYGQSWAWRRLAQLAALSMLPVVTSGGLYMLVQSVSSRSVGGGLFSLMLVSMQCLSAVAFVRMYARMRAGL